METVLHHQISPFGRVGGFHLRRCQEFEVNHYDFTLGRLAYESLRPVQDPGSDSRCPKFKLLNEPSAIVQEITINLIIFGIFVVNGCHGNAIEVQDFGPGAGQQDGAMGSDYELGVSPGAHCLQQV